MGFGAVLLQISTEAATPGTAVDFSWLFVKMLLTLGVVSVCAVLILKYVVPRVGFLKRFQQGKSLLVLARYHLEPRKSLYVVHLGKRYLLLGVADSGIHLISEITREEAEGI